MNCVAFEPDGSHFLFGDDKDGVYLSPALYEKGNSIDFRPENKLHHDGRIVRTVAFSTDGKLMVSGGDDEYIRLLPTVGLQQEKKFAGHKGAVRSIAMLPNGQFLSGGFDGSAFLWYVNAAERPVCGPLQVPPPAKQIWAVAFVPKKDWALLGGDDGVIHVWALKRK